MSKTLKWDQSNPTREYLRLMNSACYEDALTVADMMVELWAFRTDELRKKLKEEFE